MHTMNNPPQNVNLYTHCFIARKFQLTLFEIIVLLLIYQKTKKLEAQVAHKQT